MRERHRGQPKRADPSTLPVGAGPRTRAITDAETDWEHAYPLRR